jgi:hypothetical protein
MTRGAAVCAWSVRHVPGCTEQDHTVTNVHFKSSSADFTVPRIEVYDREQKERTSKSLERGKNFTHKKHETKSVRNRADSFDISPGRQALTQKPEIERKILE